MPIAIRVWPSPNGHDVLVEVSGEIALATDPDVRRKSSTVQLVGDLARE